jgi:hypothetical protein
VASPSVAAPPTECCMFGFWMSPRAKPTEVATPSVTASHTVRPVVSFRMPPVTRQQKSPTMPRPRRECQAAGPRGRACNLLP